MGTNLKILLIEDDADDIELLEEALRLNKINYSLDIVMEGDLVAPYINQPNNIPQIILLDFNLPKVHGREILKLIKKSSDFQNIPLIVLTTSAAKEDMDYALGLGAKHFLTKPTSISGFNRTISTIVDSVKAS